MPDKQYNIPINENCHIAVQFFTMNGRVKLFVVLLMLRRNDGEFITVARYDTAHGKPHLDIVNARGRLLSKEWLSGMSFKDSLSFAINDFKANHENYCKIFNRRSSSR